MAVESNLSRLAVRNLPSPLVEVGRQPFPELQQLREGESQQTNVGRCSIFDFPHLPCFNLCWDAPCEAGDGQAGMKLSEARMANAEKQVPENVRGDFFVDSTCIDCDACRQIAPSTFGQGFETSFVKSQPFSATERRHALQALLSCPTGSIGCLGGDDVKAVISDFPLAIEEPVFYCGFNSRKSYGGNSYFIQHKAGNWLIDSPKFVTPLVRKFERLGGVDHIFLTHQDDVADAESYARHFKSRRIIHRDELSSQPDAEFVLEGTGPWELAPGFLGILTPGHTKGHCVLLFENRFLFTGDHLDWDRNDQKLSASKDYCWFSWSQQIESMKRLADYQFEWVLPGHGQKVNLDVAKMREEILRLADSMARE